MKSPSGSSPPRRHFTLPGCSSKQEMEMPCRRRYPVERNLRAAHRSEVSQVWLGSPSVGEEEETFPNAMSCIAHVRLPSSSLVFVIKFHGKRPSDDSPDDPESGPSPKRQKSSTPPSHRGSATPDYVFSPSTNPLVPPSFIPTPPETQTRPWKDVYCERLTIERNWRRGRCTVRTLRGHKDGVMCLQINENLTHPSFPILITGSYDRTARVWNLETGTQIHCLEGHTSAIRSLQFDEVKLVTGSMDRTIRIWNWRMGTCLRVLEGHTEGVVCVNFDADVLASGSVDTTIKIWDFRNGGTFTLRGHTDWVNCVQLWDSHSGEISSPQTPGRAQLGAFPSSAIANLDWTPVEHQSTHVTEHQLRQDVVLCIGRRHHKAMGSFLADVRPDLHRSRRSGADPQAVLHGEVVLRVQAKGFCLKDDRDLDTSLDFSQTADDDQSP
jgi:WD40 repeat protein